MIMGKKGVTMNNNVKVKLFKVSFWVIMIFSVLQGFNVEAATIRLSTKKQTISVNSKFRLYINTKRKVKWKTCNRKVATVSSNGMVTGKGVGKTKIRAIVNNKKVFTCEVIVDNPRISKQYCELEKGMTDEIEITGTNRKIIWESTNEDIVQVEDGEVIAINEGKAEIVASIGKDIELVCLVTVNNVKKTEVTAICFDESNIILDTLGQTRKIHITIFPYEATNNCILTWKSDNTNIVTVTSKGIIQACGEGVANINVSTENGITGSIQIQVVLSKEAQAVYLETSKIYFESLNEQIELNASIEPFDTADQSLIWRSSNEDVAIVDDCGIVQAIQNGIAVITVSTKNGKSASCLVTVNLKNEIIIDETNIILTGLAEEKQIHYTLKDVNQEKKISWISEDKTVATVSSEGVVRAIGEGTTRIQIKLSNGNIVYCQVTVKFADDNKEQGSTS